MKNVEIKSIILKYLLIISNILKWTVLGIFLGVCVGLVSSGFIWLLTVTTKFTNNFSYYFILMPLGFFVSSALAKYLAPQASGHGTEKAIEAVVKYNGKMPLKVIPVKLASTVITIGTGGSCGKEGPSLQIGAAVSSSLSKIMHLSQFDTRRLVVMGMAAAFTCVFGTPLSGSLFAIEVLIIGRIRSIAILPALVSSYTALFITKSLKISYELFHPVNIIFGYKMLIITSLSGLFFGIVAIILIYFMIGNELASKKVKLYAPLKAAIAAAFLVILALIINSNYVGMGETYISNILAGENSNYYDFFFKILFTAITLSWGGSGGSLTPVVFIGAAAGNLFGQIVGIDPTYFACVGIVCVLSGACNTPLTALLLNMELFGLDCAMLSSIAIFVSFLFAGHRSIFPTQVLIESKIHSLKLLKVRTVEHDTSIFNLNKNSRFLKFFKIDESNIEQNEKKQNTNNNENEKEIVNLVKEEINPNELLETKKIEYLGSSLQNLQLNSGTEEKNKTKKTKKQKNVEKEKDDDDYGAPDDKYDI